MPDTPLLVFARPELVRRAKLSSGHQPLRVPSAARQGERLAPQFRALERQFRERRAQLQTDTRGVEPEEVLVLETVGPVDRFMRAASKIDGLEWLSELDAEIEPDEDFSVEDDDRALHGRAYLLLSNQRALREMLTLWRSFRADPRVKFERGLAPWKQLFAHLHDVRTWQPTDRVDAAAWREWDIRVQGGTEVVEVEVELFFHSGEARRAEAALGMRRLLTEAGGTVLDEAEIPAIAYHALLVRLPIRMVRELVAQRATALVNAREVMFYRPHSQCLVLSPRDEAVELRGGDADGPLPTGAPRVALLDGLPVERHARLRDRLVVDDPDDWSASVPVDRRRHGTAMASAIIWGDLHEPGPPLSTPLAVRPILLPVDGFEQDLFVESMPGERLAVDLVHRAVVRLLDGDEARANNTASVRIINLSVADRTRPFDGPMSPWARLLDWLSWKYRVLFVVSAGNHPSEIDLEISAQQLREASDDAIRSAALSAIRQSTHERRILSPAESVNALTVGALHSDAASTPAPDHLLDVLRDGTLPSPVNPLGPGFNRSVKPELLAPGGRVYYVRPLEGDTPARLRVARTTRFGVKVAAPGPAGAELTHAECQCGTSPATALVTRGCAQLLATVEQLDLGVEEPDRFQSVLLRTLAVHSASWGERRAAFRAAFERAARDPSHLRQLTTQFLGYGAVNFERVRSSTEKRATVVGVGTVAPEEGRVFIYPLPYALSGRREWRRLTLTLAWLTPVQSGTRDYRSARLWFAPPTRELLVDRQDALSYAVTRGTVQHEVLVGEAAAVYAEGESLTIQVSCRSPNGRRDDPVPFALAVTLEVAEGSQIDVYEEVRSRIATPVPIRPQA